MISIHTQIPGLLVIEPKVFRDHRGFFFESFNRREFLELTGRDADFVQDNHSRSTKNALHGLHYQICHPQGKLVRVVKGAIRDIAVDIRRGSPTFGKYVETELSAENTRMLWVPEGFAHGFVSVSDTVELLYKLTDYWYPEHERCIRWDDRDLAIDWKLEDAAVILSDRDARGIPFAEAELFE
jgi:dTDP-4-dehydrorhamnose 3,5-epimerase